MVSVDISLTPSLPGVSLPLSLSLNKRILGDFMGIMFFRQDSLKSEGRCHADLRIKTRPVGRLILYTYYIPCTPTRYTVKRSVPRPSQLPARTCTGHGSRPLASRHPPQELRATLQAALAPHSIGGSLRGGVRMVLAVDEARAWVGSTVPRSRDLVRAVGGGARARNAV